MLEWLSQPLLADHRRLFSSSLARSACCAFPDVYCRLHALAKADNLDLGFILLGLAVQADSLAAALEAPADLAAGAGGECRRRLRHRPPGPRARHRPWRKGGGMTLAFDLLLALALLWSAWRSRRPALDRAIVLFIAFGLLMALAWARLARPISGWPKQPSGPA